MMCIDFQKQIIVIILILMLLTCAGAHLLLTPVVLIELCKGNKN